MIITVVETQVLSNSMERWKINVSKDKFREFGFYLETLEGVGLHRRSFESENLMEVDVAVGFKDELLSLINALQETI